MFEAGDEVRLLGGDRRFAAEPMLVPTPPGTANTIPCTGPCVTPTVEGIAGAVGQSTLSGKTMVMARSGFLPIPTAGGVHIGGVIVGSNVALDVEGVAAGRVRTKSVLLLMRARLVHEPFGV